MNSATTHRALVLTVAFLLVLAVALYFYSVWQRLNEPPYVLVMTPAENGAMLQFVQPEGYSGGAEVSPLFHVDVELDAPAVETCLFVHLSHRMSLGDSNARRRQGRQTINCP
ncbi:hypothetical protein [Lacipirellula sp.]|uniref:hypothetical protein n=1 Tax=Lacipirellula sp. TaxID=2691419 RepID=UPI003D09997C